VGKAPANPGRVPRYPAPVVRNDTGGRKLVMIRAGMPPPPSTGRPPVINIRNTASPALARLLNNGYLAAASSLPDDAVEGDVWMRAPWDETRARSDRCSGSSRGARTRKTGQGHGRPFAIWLVPAGEAPQSRLPNGPYVRPDYVQDERLALTPARFSRPS
jgi:hypothetical protein